ncbi:MAG TPA: hypothetical protein VGH19_06505 [Verrucomicrobiae bacterium]
MKRKLKKWWDGFVGRRRVRLRALRAVRRQQERQRAIRELDALEAELLAMYDSLPTGHRERVSLNNDIFRLRSMRVMAGL